MGAMSPWHWAIVVAAAVLVFGGGGKISGLMGDAARGIRAFKEGLNGSDSEGPPAA